MMLTTKEPDYRSLDVETITKDQEQLTAKQEKLVEAIRATWLDAALNSGGRCDPRRLRQLGKRVMAECGFNIDEDMIMVLPSPAAAQARIKELNAESGGPSWLSMGGDAGWAAESEFYATAGIEDPWSADMEEKRQILIEMFLAGAWTAYYYDKFVIFVMPPVEVHRDEQGRLHNPKGPAISFADARGQYFWHGVRMEPEWIERPDEVDPQLAITLQDTERRQALAECLGWDRVLKDLDAKIIDEHEDPEMGTLLEAMVPNPDNGGRKEPLRFLRVLCGTGRTFYIPCPIDVNTVQEAQNANHGFTDGDSKYNPVLRV